jgi:hypothetical protein
MTRSIYEQLNEYDTVAKQRVVETFSGDALDTDRWHTGNSTGTGTVVMEDVVDGGVKLDTGSSSSRVEINFQNKRQYDSQGSEVIWVAKTGQLTNTELLFGLADNNATASLDDGFVEFHSTNSSNWRLNKAFSQWVDTSLAVDTNWHNFKLTLGASNVKLSIDGILSGTGYAVATTEINSDKLQPEFHLHDLAVTTNTASARYCEAYNT